MNKKLIASMAAACVLSTGSVFAASNPFADVPTKHWSYGAVQSLSQAGIIDGYSDATFGGDKSITRYEMAQIVAKAMYRSDKATAAQKAAIERLAAEYKVELDNLGVRVDNVEKKTAGVKDLKISGWFTSENTVGNHNGGVAQGGSAVTTHEYAMEARIGFQKQINDKLSANVQFRTKSFFDSGRSTANGVTATGGDVGVGMRLGYLTYNASPVTTVTVGKNAYWMAGGLLMDDFVNGVSVDTKIGDKTNLWLLAGRYAAGGNGSQDNNLNQDKIAAASLTTTAGTIDLGAHYITGSKSINGKDGSNIVAGTAGYTFNGGLNLQLGYAVNNKADDNNKTSKVQLYKNIGGTDVILQYWDQGRNMDWVAETGCHMTWWGDQYYRSFKGYRLILERKIMDNTVLTLVHGDYKNKDTDVKSRKDTVQVTVSF